MSIAEEFIHIAGRISEVIELPVVRRFHLDTDESGSHKSSKFGILELANGTLGLTYVDLDDARSELSESICLNDYIGKHILDVVRLYRGRHAWERVLGMAAINAISQELFMASGYEFVESNKSLNKLCPEAGDHIGMVGYFPPLVQKIRDLGIRLTVIELDTSWLQRAEGFTVTQDLAQLASCNKIVSTGTTLVNHTAEQVLEYSKTADQITIMGPTIGCLPDPLFKRGVTSVGGRLILDGTRFIDLWASGKPWRDATKRYSIAKSDYPGYETLLSEATKKFPS